MFVLLLGTSAGFGGGAVFSEHIPNTRFQGAPIIKLMLRGRSPSI